MGGGERTYMVVVSQYISDEPPLSKVANGPDSKLQGEMKTTVYTSIQTINSQCVYTSPYQKRNSMWYSEVVGNNCSL